ncbi:MAG: ESX secretion-associated protein EspG [Anaerolineae bacterium]|nr:ESX secretion-associated protein EspG [Anaerolineae bacterium]
MMNRSDGIRFSDRELFFLGMLLQGQSLIGIPEPFPGWLTEEIEEQFPDIQQALQSRGLIQGYEDGSVELEDTLEASLRAVVLCDVAMIATLGTPQMEVAEQRMFYFKRPQLVELRGPEMEAESRFYTLYALDGYPATLFEELVSWWETIAQPAPNCVSVTLQEADLMKARQMALEKGAAAVIDYFTTKGVNSETATALAETLATAKKNGALVIVARDDTGWKTENSGLLEGENGLWRLHSRESGEQRLIECIPCDAAALRAELQLLLGRFIYGE